MYHIKKTLNNDEVIVYQDRPVPGTGSKDVIAEILVILFILIVQIQTRRWQL